MYRRSSYSRYGGNWYQSVFWLLVGILIGQFFRFDIVLDSAQTPTQTQPTAYEVIN